MRIGEIVVPAAGDRWQQAGFAVQRDAAGAGVVMFGDVAVRLSGPDAVLSWSMVGDGTGEPAHGAIDGIPTSFAIAADAPGLEPVAHPNGVTIIDHIVVNTPDLERTCAAIEAATGAELRRIREAGQVRQGFHRVGGLIVEVVTHPGIAPGAATLWGLALVAADLGALVAAAVPGTIRVPRAAVQPGRQIASYTHEAGLGIPVAVMTPHVRG